MNQRTKNTTQILKVTFSGVFLALCMVLPFLTMNIPQIGSMLSPMHIPVLLCGFICGWPYGALVGLIAPVLRHFVVGSPPLPIALAMAFELAAYGFMAGILYKALPKKIWSIYISLIASMLGGRIVYGIAMYSLTVFGVDGAAISWQIFIAGAVTKAVPGIILHIVLIPVVVMAMKKAKLVLND